MRSIVIITIILLSVSCDKMDFISKDNCPSCFQSLLKGSNPPREIWRYAYNNQLVYLVKPDCCDQYEQVYTYDCSKICAPGGGITGKGDGKCADFFDKATHPQLVWTAEQ